MDMAEIKKALDGITDQVKETGEKALAEAKRGIQMVEGQKERVDEMLLKQGELQAQMQELEQKQARAGQAAKEQGAKSIGYQVIENEDFKKNAARVKEKGGRVSVGVKAITSASNSAGQAIVPNYLPGVLELPRRRMTIRDLIAPGRTSAPSINYMRETLFTNNAGTVAEGTRKPESNLTLDMVNTTVKKIAHFIKATTEILDDLPGLQSMIDARLRYGLDLAEEAQMLKGSGSGNNLNGIYTQATAFVAPTGTTTTGATRIDILRLALLQSELAELPSDGIVLHPTDWALIEMLKDTTGQYLIGNPQGTLGANLWNRPVVTTQAMTQDTFLTGAFRTGAQVFDREDANVVIATENEDDFVNNQVTILAEERVAMAVYRPQAFVKGDLTPP